MLLRVARAMARHVEILSRKSTVEGGECRVHLLGVRHETEESRGDARALVRFLRPDVLFLELDKRRAKFMLITPTSEFHAAYFEARRLKMKNIVFGDRDVELTFKIWRERELDWLIRQYGRRPRKEILDEVEQINLIDERDKYMIDRILELSKHCSSIVGIVGRKHLPGMKRIWDSRAPNGGQSFRLNWAELRIAPNDGPDYTIFVGNLAPDVTDYLLQDIFRTRYNSVKGAKVVIDRLTGRSKGYGFVRFADESEQTRAMTEMQGFLCSTRLIRIGLAYNKNPATTQSQPKASCQNPQVSQNENDPNNTTIFVGNLDPNVTDDHLRQVFSQYGELVHVKIPAGKRCGFVQFADRSCAEEALRILNGTLLGGQNVRLSWGRSPSNKQGQQDPNQWGAGASACACAGGYYGYGQGYENYGYAPPAGQDPNMYGSYPGHASYQPPQQ